MKIFVRIWIAFSLVLFGIICLKIYDCHVSLKYEVDEPRIMFGDKESIVDRQNDLQAKITWLWITLSYVLISIFVSVKYLISMRGINKT
jgi:hypothetical protein